MDVEKEARKWIKDNYPLMDADNFDDCDELDVYDMIAFAKHIQKQLEQRSDPVSLKRFVSRRKAKKMRKAAITTLELTKGITGERDNTLKTMEEMANNVIELTSAY